MTGACSWSYLERSWKAAFGTRRAQQTSMRSTSPQCGSAGTVAIVRTATSFDCLREALGLPPSSSVQMSRIVPYSVPVPFATARSDDAESILLP